MAKAGLTIEGLTTDDTVRHGRKPAAGRMGSRMMPRDVESGRNEGARMIGGMIGLWGEKKVAEERKSDVPKCDENPGK